MGILHNLASSLPSASFMDKSLSTSECAHVTLGKTVRFWSTSTATHTSPVLCLPVTDALSQNHELASRTMDAVVGKARDSGNDDFIWLPPCSFHVPTISVVTNLYSSRWQVLESKIKTRCGGGLWLAIPAPANTLPKQKGLQLAEDSFPHLFPTSFQCIWSWRISHN